MAGGAALVGWLKAAWVSYKETNWVARVVWIILLVCLGSVTTCGYLTLQLFKLSMEESTHEPMSHLLLRNQNKNGIDHKNNGLRLTTARVAFSVLGFIMLGTLVYTITTDDYPFRKELLTPWLTATLIDFYINVAALSVWVSYKESRWFGKVAWIAGLICFGRQQFCYIKACLCNLENFCGMSSWA
ncbi:hypothetical protein AKJ16_DCAP01060 [Drosera capensis]